MEENRGTQTVVQSISKAGQSASCNLTQYIPISSAWRRMETSFSPEKVWLAGAFSPQDVTSLPVTREYVLAQSYRKALQGDRTWMLAVVSQTTGKGACAGYNYNYRLSRKMTKDSKDLWSKWAFRSSDAVIVLTLGWPCIVLTTLVPSSSLRLWWIPESPSFHYGPRGSLNVWLPLLSREWRAFALEMLSIRSRCSHILDVKWEGYWITWLRQRNIFSYASPTFPVEG